MLFVTVNGASKIAVKLRARLEAMYLRYNRVDLIHPDPLEFVYRYTAAADREIAGLVAACLAYGRVAQILAGVDRILKPMGPSPSLFLRTARRDDVVAMAQGFKHRWTTGADVAGLLLGVKGTVAEFGSLEAAFRSVFRPDHQNVLPALCEWVGLLMRANGGQPIKLLASPADGSACKRLLLFLRWMVRKDDVDPGVWSGIPPSKLLVPMDTHMHRISLALKLTRRKQADLRTALEVTHAFRQIAPEDPVRYDFALTRAGMRGETFSGRLRRRGT